MTFFNNLKNTLKIFEQHPVKCLLGTYIVIRHLIPLKEIECNSFKDDKILSAESRNYILFNRLEVWRDNPRLCHNSVTYYLRRNVPKINVQNETREEAEWIYNF